MLAAYLLRRPDRSAPTVPSATGRVEIAAETAVPVGGVPVRVRLAAIHGIGFAPTLVWLDGDGDLFASGAGWLISIVRGAEAVLPTLRALETRYSYERDSALAARFAPRSAPALVIQNGDLFDSETGTARPNTMVVVSGERIVAVGPAASTREAAGATVVDATGKTIIPGLWDMHTDAFIGSADGLMQLAAGTVGCSSGCSMPG